MLSAKKTPHVVLDFTMTGVGSETVKSFTAALGLATVSGSFGQAGDLRQWRNLNSNQSKFLLQVMPPADILPESIRAIVTKQEITNAAIIFDEFFGMFFHSFIVYTKIADNARIRSCLQRYSLNRYHALANNNVIKTVCLQLWTTSTSLYSKTYLLGT